MVLMLIFEASGNPSAGDPGIYLQGPLPPVTCSAKRFFFVAHNSQRLA